MQTNANAIYFSVVLSRTCWALKTCLMRKLWWRAKFLDTTSA